MPLFIPLKKLNAKKRINLDILQSAGSKMMVENANGMVLASARTVLSPVHPDATTAQSYT